MNKINFAVALTFVFLNIASAKSADVIHHPAPKTPIYLETSLYEVLKKQLPPLPAKNSAAQKADEKEIFELQKNRTKADCEQAQIEAPVSLNNFYGPSKSALSKDQVEKLAPFFEQIRNDADFFIQNMKKDFYRDRPFIYLKGVTPCVPKEVTGAYPSGHATLSKLYALILTDIFPANAQKFETRAKEIGKNRILSGMHHPTDIEAGRNLAEFIYKELKKSKSYEAAFKEVAAKVK